MTNPHKNKAKTRKPTVKQTNPPKVNGVNVKKYNTIAVKNNKDHDNLPEAIVSENKSLKPIKGTSAGRPKAHITDKQRKEITLYRAMNMPIRVIAKTVGIPASTITKHCKTEFEEAKQMSVMRAAKNMGKLMDDVENNPRVAFDANKFWLEKNHEDFKKKTTLDVTNSDNSLSPDVILLPVGARILSSKAPQVIEGEVIKD